MKHGAVNILGFIGTHSAAQQLHQAHPHPFSVRLALGLDAKNPAIVSSNQRGIEFDVFFFFQVTASADLNVAASEVTLGALSFNGERVALLFLFLIICLRKDNAALRSKSLLFITRLPTSL